MFVQLLNTSLFECLCIPAFSCDNYAEWVLGVLERLCASTCSATVTIAHRIIFTYQKEVECRCACGRYLIILIYHVFRPRKFENRLNIKASIQFLEEFVS